MKNYKI